VTSEVVNPDLGKVDEVGLVTLAQPAGTDRRIGNFSTVELFAKACRDDSQLATDLAALTLTLTMLSAAPGHAQVATALTIRIALKSAHCDGLHARVTPAASEEYADLFATPGGYSQRPRGESGNGKP